MSWFKRLLPGVSTTEKKGVPEGVWAKCPSCQSVLYYDSLAKNKEVCPKCDHHLRIGARRRLDYFLDSDGRVDFADEIGPVDRLKFRDSKKYRDRLVSAQKKTGETEAAICSQGAVLGVPVVVVAFDFFFIY